MADPLRIAVVGYGQIARSHTRIMGPEGHALRWLIGRVPERTAAFAQENGFAKHSTNLADALSDPEVDAVILCTPSEQHAEQTAQCLHAGKHVLVEIPLAMTFAEGQQLAQLARRQKRTVMVAHTHRYQPAIRRAKAKIDTGELTLHSVVARYMFLRRENVGANGYVRSWTDNLLWHHGQHATDMCLWLLGVEGPGEVEVGSMLALPDRDLEIPLDLTLVLRTARDQLATVAMSYNSHVSLFDYVLIGVEDTLVVENGVLRSRESVLYDPKTDDSEEKNAGLLQNREFVTAIREGRQPAISADAVLPALDALQQAQNAYDEYREGRGKHPIR
ncbi:MAG TPA: Gfo/Idh/MocA family oxidoreductase [Chloroflexota bacterium]|nr:Gfo/Idh/MocA family oxidoreductase [Chloroflexota bacterium]